MLSSVSTAMRGPGGPATRKGDVRVGRELFLLQRPGIRDIKNTEARTPTSGDVVTGPTADERFQSIFEAHSADIQRYCYRRLLDTDEADDAAADVFLVLWRRLDVCPAGGAARLWLFGVARNVVRDHQRHRRRAARLKLRLREGAPGAYDDVPAAVAVRRDEQREVGAALARLSERDREVLRLKLWEQLSHKEIARVLGISAHAVDMRTHRALERIAEALRSPMERASVKKQRTAGVDHG